LLCDLLVAMIPVHGPRKGIAIVRVDAIGDFILWLDSAKEFRGIFPNERIILIANRVWAELARQFPYWDDVIPVDGRKLAFDFLYRYRFLTLIRKKGFHTAVQPTYSRVCLHGDSIVRATAAQARIGSVGDLSNMTRQEKKKSDRWYTELVPASDKPLMELYRNAEFISNLARRDFVARVAEIPEDLSDSSFVHEHAYAVLFPGASWSGKEWPLKNFIATGLALKDRFDLDIILCGDSNDQIRCRKIAAEIGDRCTDLSGKTTLVQLISILRRSALLISNDTSAVHIAAAVGLPAVCILGGGHYGRFLPYPEELTGSRPLCAVHHMPCFNCNWNCIYPLTEEGAVRCVARVKVGQVMALVEQVAIGLPACHTGSPRG